MSAGHVRKRIEGFPRGWFMVAFSDEVKQGEILSMHYFNRRLMAWRGEDGVVRIQDAHCPHLGADIGAGGKVIGNTVQCPFHHWAFDDSGKCVEIPYSESIPKKACLKTWHVVERNGMLYLWFNPHDHESTPEFDVPVTAYDTEEGWSEWRHSKIRIKTHSREIVENVVDIGHFQPVHGTHVETFENEFNGHIAIQRNTGVAYPRGGGKDRFSLEATYYGPGFQITNMQGYLNAMLVNAHTMVEDNVLDLRFGVSIKAREGEVVTEEMKDKYIENLTVGFLEDVQIWENKVYRDLPMLCAGDGPIGKLRRWYGQFYDNEAAE